MKKHFDDLAQASREADKTERRSIRRGRLQKIALIVICGALYALVGGWGFLFLAALFFLLMLFED